MPRNRTVRFAVLGNSVQRTAAGYPPPVCVDCPSCGTSVAVGSGDQVVLTRSELARLLAEAVERFGGARS